MKKAQTASLSAENDDWLRKATSSAVARIRELIGPKDLILPDVRIGKLALGLDPDTAMERAARCARDTIPPSRWRTILHLLDNPGTEPNSACLDFERLLPAIRNDLEVLRMLGLAPCRVLELARLYHTRSVCDGVAPKLL